MPKYRVIGPHPFQKHDPGEEFDAKLPKDLEARAIARGAIERAKPKKERASASEADKPSTGDNQGASRSS